MNTQGLRTRPNRLRTGLVLAFSAVMVAALGVLDAPGYVAHAADSVLNAVTSDPSSSNSGPGNASTSGTDQYAVNHGICHRIGNKNNPWQLIVVSAAALDGHAAHGDVIPAPKWGCPPATRAGTRPRATTTQIGGASTARVHQRVTFFVQLPKSEGVVPTGTVSCIDDLTRFAGSIRVHDGAARCSTAFESIAQHEITAVYKTDDVNKFAGSAAVGVLTVTVSPRSD